MKIYIVKAIWRYCENPDNFIMNGYTDNIEKIFNSEEKAIKYIQNEVKKMLVAKLETIEAIEKRNKGEDYDSFIALRDYISLDTIPTEDELKKSHCIIYDYDEDLEEQSSYEYDIWEVE